MPLIFPVAIGGVHFHADGSYAGDINGLRQFLAELEDDDTAEKPIIAALGWLFLKAIESGATVANQIEQPAGADARPN